MQGTSRVSLLNELSWVDLSVRKKLHKLSLMYKMVFKLAPPYLCDLCPDFFSDRSCYSLRSARNLCSSYLPTERHKKSFLFSSTKWWNSFPLEIRWSFSLGIFKHSLLKYLQLYWGSFSVNISHLLALKYHLFQRSCCLSPTCPLCNAPVVDPSRHYFLYCPILLLCVKSCLPPLQNYSGIDEHCASDK